jgi:hypothetical protein
MKEPQHPPGPAFEDAREEREAWRRQQIAALTPEQRKQYDALRKEHDAFLEAKRGELREGERGRIEEKMREYIAKEYTPEFRPGKARDNYLAQAKRLHAAIPDYAAGKQTPETKALARPLSRAHGWAYEKESREQADALRPLQRELQGKHDQFLERCENQRQKDGEVQEVRQAAREVTREKANPRFNDAARDGWQQAILRAARQEAERSRDHDLTRDFNKIR